MNRQRVSRLVRTGVVLCIALAALVLTGCFNPFNPRVASTLGVSEPPPQPDSPRNALLLFKWCWENRDYDEYRELLTEDFRFAFAVTDTFGQAYLVRGWTREDELESSKHLFITGKADQAVASQIILVFDTNLLTFPDSRPGKTDPWHKEITTRVNLTVEFSDGTATRSNGSARFFFVSGDSALIPPELHAQPDPHRWFIERYEEEEGGAGLVDPGLEAVRVRIATSDANAGVRLPAEGRVAHASGDAPAARIAPHGGTPRGLEGRRGADGLAERFDITWGHLKKVFR